MPRSTLSAGVFEDIRNPLTSSVYRSFWIRFTGSVRPAWVRPSMKACGAPLGETTEKGLYVSYPLCAPIPTGDGAVRRWLGLGALLVESHAMGLLTFGLNVTLDGCIDHTQGIVDDELHDYWTQLMDQSGAMLFGRNTYELMEGAWPAVARDEKAPRAMREWAQKLEAKAKYVVSGSRSDFPWQNTIKVEGDLREAISALKAKTERGVLVGAPKLAAALEELGLIDEYRIVVHPIISGRGPTLFHGLSSARHLELLSTQRFKSGVQALHFRRKAG